jgi:hypothetical protein
VLAVFLYFFVKGCAMKALVLGWPTTKDWPQGQRTVDLFTEV